MEQVVQTVVLILAVVLAGCSVPYADARATVTVVNENSQAYELTAYVITESVGAGNVSFRATNQTGRRQTVERIELATGNGFSNVTLAERWNATATMIPVPANRTASATLSNWEPGNAVVYVVEVPSGRLVRTEYDECGRATIRSRFVFSDGPQNGYQMSCTA